MQTFLLHFYRWLKDKEKRRVERSSKNENVLLNKVLMELDLLGPLVNFRASDKAEDPQGFPVPPRL